PEPVEGRAVELRALTVQHARRPPPGARRPERLLGLVVARDQQSWRLDRRERLDGRLEPAVHGCVVAYPEDDVGPGAHLDQAPRARQVAVQVAEGEQAQGGRCYLAWPTC